MPPSHVITIGHFDGVHRGHQAILAEARSAAARHDARVVALAFDPHPATILRPDRVPPRLVRRDEKIELLCAAGADDVQILEPSTELLSRTPDQFVHGLLERFDLEAVVEGEYFRFGKGRAGDVALLRRMGQAHGFDVRTVAADDVSLSDQLQVSASSSLIRWLLVHGRAMDAARCLGRFHTLSGQVVSGAKRGRTIGVPTANLDPTALGELLVPANGVYAGRVRLDDQSTLPAAVNVGTKPTFGDAARTVEAHLLDFDRDLYGQTIRIDLCRWLRDEQRFPGVEALKAQLRRDVDQTRRLHEGGLLDSTGAAAQHEGIPKLEIR